MPNAPDLLHRIRVLVKSGRYRLRLHAVQHMLEEGFDEGNIIEALTGLASEINEEYPEQQRCLVLGSYAVSARTRNFLHAVCDYSDPEVLDIVTAYIPQRPWWETPTRRGRRR